MICKNCGDEFSPDYKDENGVKHNMRNRKYCLICSPFKKHNTIRIHEKVYFEPGHKKCLICKNIKEFNEFSGGTFSYCKICDAERVVINQREFKDECVKYKNGKCQICGYNKSNSALHFHHLDASKKDFIISSKHCIKMNDKIKEELDKCILVCANCHSEIHYGLHPEKFNDS